MRKSQVTKMIKAAKEHEKTAAANGWRATPESDRTMSTYVAARRNATPEELATFAKVYGMENGDATSS